jgi:hypothetical protein
LALRSRPAGGGFKPPRAAPVKSRGGERRGKVAPSSAAGVDHEGERKRTTDDVSKDNVWHRNRGWFVAPGRAWRVPVDWPGGVRHGGGASVVWALARNVGTCRPVATVGSLDLGSLRPSPGRTPSGDSPLSEPVRSFLRVGSEIGHRNGYARCVRPDVVTPTRSGGRLSDRAAAFPRRLYATASPTGAKRTTSPPSCQTSSPSCSSSGSSRHASTTCYRSTTGGSSASTPTSPGARSSSRATRNCCSAAWAV